MTPRALVVGQMGLAEAAALLIGEIARAPRDAPVRVESGDHGLAWCGDVLEMSVDTHQPTVDVTSFGDIFPQRYATGSTEVRLRLVTAHDPAIGPPSVGDAIWFDRIVSGRRLRGRVLVTRAVMRAPIHSVMTVEIDAVGVGPFTFDEPEVVDVVAQVSEPGQRAIAYGGLSDA